ncbi:MAG: hypothetical protein ACW963_01830 [Candidatus Sifarchaeia archaeon]
MVLGEVWYGPRTAGMKFVPQKRKGDEFCPVGLVSFLNSQEISRLSAKYKNNLKEMSKTSVHHRCWNLVSLLLLNDIPEAVIPKAQHNPADFLYQKKARGEQIWQSY